MPVGSTSVLNELAPVIKVERFQSSKPFRYSEAKQSVIHT